MRKLQPHKITDIRSLINVRMSEMARKNSQVIAISSQCFFAIARCFFTVRLITYTRARNSHIDYPDASYGINCFDIFNSREVMAGKIRADIPRLDCSFSEERTFCGVHCLWSHTFAVPRSTELVRMRRPPNTRWQLYKFLDSGPCTVELFTSADIKCNLI